MAEIIRMPKLSDTMTEGLVSKWHKKIGDTIKSGDLLADIETDKATMEFESFSEGVLLHIGVKEGSAAPVNSILAILGKKSENISALLKEEEKQASSKQAPEPISKEAEKPKADLPKENTPTTNQKQEVVVSQPSSSRASSDLSIKASPLARRLAKEKGINLNRIKGTGEGGRIIKRDVDGHASSGANIPMVESFKEVPLSQMRKTIARRLSESKFSAPHFYLTIEVDMGEAITARKQINVFIAPDKVSFNDLIIRACARALTDHKAVNSSWMDDHIQENQHVHIGVAMAIEDGLVVPVVKFANAKRITEISSQVKEFAEKAQHKKLQPTDFSGNTFTISNLGMFGIEEFTAIVNPPDACILAVGSIKEGVAFKGDVPQKAHLMKLTLSCDHRVVDGATGAKFLNDVKRYLESPVLLLGEQMI